MKMYDAGEPNETLFGLIEKNVRVPVRVLGDMRAQLAACHLAEAAFVRLVECHGPETVMRSMQELIDYTERLTRAALRQLPDDVWSFEDWIDDPDTLTVEAAALPPSSQVAQQTCMH